MGEKKFFTLSPRGKSTSILQRISYKAEALFITNSNFSLTSYCLRSIIFSENTVGEATQGYSWQSSGDTTRWSASLIAKVQDPSSFHVALGKANGPFLTQNLLINLGLTWYMGRTLFFVCPALCKKWKGETYETIDVAPEAAPNQSNQIGVRDSTPSDWLVKEIPMS